MGRSGRSGRRFRRQLRHPGHEGTRTVLRIVGPLVVALGLFFMVYGVYDFSQGFGNHRPPRGFPGFDLPGETVEVDEGGSKFWMCFLGVPLLGIGAMICRFAYLGAAARYVAGEAAPVVADTFTYMARNSRDGIRDVAGAVRDGLRDDARDSIECPGCGERNDADANFCDNCGGSFPSKSFCPSCGEENDGSANFCNGCGGRIS